LKQRENAPMAVEKQVAIIYLGTKGLLTAVPVNKVKAFEEEYTSFLDAKHRNVLDDIRAGKFTDEIIKILEATCKELSAKYSH
jgi:F-type H+-transporting ATPase subunit alpha